MEFFCLDWGLFDNTSILCKDGTTGAVPHLLQNVGKPPDPRVPEECPLPLEYERSLLSLLFGILPDSIAPLRYRSYSVSPLSGMAPIRYRSYSVPKKARFLRDPDPRVASHEI